MWKDLGANDRTTWRSDRRKADSPNILPCSNTAPQYGGRKTACSVAKECPTREKELRDEAAKAAVKSTLGVANRSLPRDWHRKVLTIGSVAL
ncbi:hypothetical protein J7T55_005794 [Diaporthe amygdali]|uniref:uncharacterized protein n=1 Tax=Phomopsis amygdali TaxID=1214568 RepID=UPI0022FE8BC2|nr:uncharacterized protein J7T55_005794 [Diaporthe amygdali]KAJ0124456.1 hypothetical protein J7T55_005794 [Diaporthe amygdali]